MFSCFCSPPSLGQVADYMYFFNLKYGFLTTYDQTIFLKQEKVNGAWRLYYSSPILASNGEMPGDSWNSKEQYDPENVSVRQCMLWLCRVTRGGPENYSAHNDTPVKQWVCESTSNRSQLVSPFRAPLYHLPHNYPASKGQPPKQHHSRETQGPISTNSNLYLTGPTELFQTPRQQIGQEPYKCSKMHLPYCWTLALFRNS